MLLLFDGTLLLRAADAHREALHEAITERVRTSVRAWVESGGKVLDLPFRLPSLWGTDDGVGEGGASAAPAS